MLVLKDILFLGKKKAVERQLLSFSFKMITIVL